jgi:hypothetical protein
MARVILFLFVSFFILNARAGTFSAGIMVGGNTALSNFNIKAPLQNTDSKLGYLINGFVRVKILSLIIQPEFGYTLNRTGFTGSVNNKTAETTLTHSEYYTSALLGYKLGNLRFMGGPISYTSASPAANTGSSTDITVNAGSSPSTVKWGGQIGLGLDISKHWLLDARFQKILTPSQYSSDISKTINTFDGSLGAVSLSLGYSFFRM